MSSRSKDVNGRNYRKAKGLAFARSGGKCQFCGLRKASDGHHWAWPNYPSDEEVQGHDITALCKTCHELATMLRDWVEGNHADFDQLGKEITDSNSFYEKREAFSYWLFPEEEKNYRKPGNPQALADIPVSSPEWTLDLLEIEPTGDISVNTDAHASVKTKERGSIKDQMYGWQVQIEYLKDVRNAIRRQMERWERGERLDSPAALKDAKEIAQATSLLPNPTWDELNSEYKSVGREMGDAIKRRESLRKQQNESKGCGFFLALCVIGVFLYVILSPFWT